MSSFDSNTTGMNNNTRKHNNPRGFNTTSIVPKAIDVVTNVIPEPSVPKRKCILCIRGHVNTGKTSFVSLLSSHDTSKVGKQLNSTEAGLITQQVGTQTFSRENIIKFIPPQLQEKFNMDFVTIDTPGHTDFENIRKMGSNISHITLVFVNIVKGIDQDTLEFLQENIQSRADYEKTILVLNKMDCINDYKTVGFGNLKKVMNRQSEHTTDLFDKYYTNIIIQLSNYGLYGEPYHRRRQTECLAMIPISARFGDGIPDLLLYMSNARMNLIRPENNIGYFIDKRNDPRIGKIIVGIMKYGSILRSNAFQIGSSTIPIKHLFHFGNHDSREQYIEPIDQVDEATAFAITVDESVYNIIDLGVSFEPTEHTTDIVIDVETYQEYVNRKTKLLSSVGVCVIVPSDSMIEGVHSNLSTNNIPLGYYCIGSITKQDLIRYNNQFNDQKTEYNNRFKIIMICIPDMTDDIDNEVLMRRFFDEDKLKFLRTENIKVIFGGTVFKLSSEFNRHLLTFQQAFVRNYAKYSNYNATTLNKCIFRVSNPIICGVKINNGILVIGSTVRDEHNVDYGIVESIEHNKKSINYATVGMDVCVKIISDKKIVKTQQYTFQNQKHLTSEIVGADIKAVML